MQSVAGAVAFFLGHKAGTQSQRKGKYQGNTEKLFHSCKDSAFPRSDNSYFRPKFFNELFISFWQILVFPEAAFLQA